MKVAVYTMTRDRLDYTKHCFQSLWNNAGVDFDHFILDNGSTDGTVEWLNENNALFKNLQLLDKNVGISVASNLLIDMILEGDYDLIVKVDNDCEVLSKQMLLQIVNFYSALPNFFGEVVVSPYVYGINRQPERSRYTTISGRRFGVTGIVGGLFRAATRKVMELYRFPENLPMAYGSDGAFCEWAIKTGCILGYMEGAKVNHYETTNGQAVRYPEYFKRKLNEEKK